MSCASCTRVASSFSGYLLLPRSSVSEWYSRKDKIRGALTNGHEWVFIILYFDAHGKGASYKHSDIVRYRVTVDGKPEEPYPDAIAGVLSYWVGPSS